jgi:hypothetical protein
MIFQINNSQANQTTSTFIRSNYGASWLGKIILDIESKHPENTPKNCGN